MSLLGQVALVTGAASGIGEAIASRLAADRAHVVVADIAQDSGKALADRLQAGAAGQQRVVFVPMDVTDPSAVTSAVADVTAELGDVDILVNCAGADVIQPFLETDEAFWTWVAQINLFGWLRTTQAVLPRMVERGSGRIINIASDAGRVGSSGEAVYSACKGGMIAFTKSLAREVARSQVTVNAVCPGPTNTPATSKTLEAGGEKIIAALKRAVPLGRLGEPDDVAGAVAFFASADAAFITGQTLSVSGGLSMC